MNRLSWKTVLPIRMCFLLSALGGDDDDDGQQTMCALRFFISPSFSIFFSLYMTNWQMMFSLDYIMGTCAMLNGEPGAPEKYLLSVYINKIYCIYEYILRCGIVA